MENRIIAPPAKTEMAGCRRPNARAYSGLLTAAFCKAALHFAEASAGPTAGEKR